MKTIMLLLIAVALLACNNEASDTNNRDTLTAPVPDSVVHDNLINRDTAPGLTVPFKDSAGMHDSLTK